MSQPQEKKYQYKILSQKIIDHAPFTFFELYDLQSSNIIYKSSLELIKEIEILKAINPAYYSMICSAAVEDQIKYEMLQNKSALIFKHCC